MSRMIANCFGHRSNEIKARCVDRDAIGSADPIHTDGFRIISGRL